VHFVGFRWWLVASPLPCPSDTPMLGPAFTAAIQRRTPAPTRPAMNVLLAFLLWCLLFAVSWPLALLALILWPVVWLLTLPLRLVGIGVGAAFTFVKAVLYLPARLLGMKP
jgi:hypothetical protein